MHARREIYIRRSLDGDGKQSVVASKREGGRGEFRPPSGFRQGRKLDRRQVAGQSITEAGSVTGFDVKSMQILISM